SGGSGAGGCAARRRRLATRHPICKMNRNRRRTSMRVMIAGLVLWIGAGALYAQEPAGVMAAGGMGAVKGGGGGEFWFGFDIGRGRNPVEGSAGFREWGRETQ